MNVITTAPQFDSVAPLIPDNPAGPASDTFAFLSLLSWLTEDVLPPAKAEAAPGRKDKPDTPDKPDKLDTREPQVTLAIELPPMAFPVKPPLVLDKATPAAAVAPIIAAQSEPQTNTGWKACATWVEAAITAQTGLDQANTGWKASATWATPSGTVQAVPDQSNTGGKACATQLAFAAILTDRTATITAQAKPDQTNTGWKACATAAVREVPPEPTKAPVITVAPVEIGSNKPQTPANPSPIHSEPPKGELKTEINSPIHPQPTRQISLKLTGTESGSVDVRISERAGKVQVDVRTPDGQLARTLRADLGDLVGRLDKRGFDAETSIPQNHLALTIRSPERPENNADPGSKQSQGQDSPHPQGERRGGRPRHGRGRGFAEVITERNEETHVNSN